MGRKRCLSDPEKQLRQRLELKCIDSLGVSRKLTGDVDQEASQELAPTELVSNIIPQVLGGVKDGKD